MPTPRKSDAMHALSGTKSQATTPDIITPPGRPKCPKEFTKEQRRIFKQVCKLLETRRALTAGDGELLRVYVVTFVRWQRALSFIETEGEICKYVRMDSNGQPHDQFKTNLWLPVAEKAEQKLISLCDRLGLTPLNRSKVKPTGEQEKPAPELTDEEKYFAALDSGKRRSTWLAPPVEESL
jgi:P27 family predicted phage terminase small subunit